MNRRAFLGLLGAVAASAALDAERLLWRPGARLISIPQPRVPPFLAVGDIVSFAPYDTRYIVTTEALSMNDIGDARFKLEQLDERYFPVDGLYLSPAGWPSRISPR